MDYFDQTFWRMALGFTAIIGIGLLGVYLLSAYQGEATGGLTLLLK